MIAFGCRVLLSALLGAFLGLAGVAAQESPAKRSPAPVIDRALTEAERLRAVKLLRQHGQRSSKLRVLVADYVQRRTTTISKRPLVSKGAFLFAKQPACVVFRAGPPRSSVVRLTPGVYEVYRPRRKRLERFRLGSTELARGLFAALAGDADKLLADFSVSSMVEADGQVRIGMRPKVEAVRDRLRELSLRLGAKDAKLAAVCYRDHSGDLIEIELAKVRINPKDAPSASLTVPAGTSVIEHDPPKPAKPARPAEPAKQKPPQVANRVGRLAMRPVTRRSRSGLQAPMSSQPGRIVPARALGGQPSLP